jgi:hypothetical protein
MYIIYKSKQKMSIAFLSIYFLVFIMSIFFLKINFNYLWLSILILDIFVVVNFFYLNFKITSMGLEFGFGIFKRVIKREYIHSAYIDNSIGNFFGLGIISKNKKFAFIAKRGDGLSIKLKDGVTFFVSSDESENILNIMKKEKYV